MHSAEAVCPVEDRRNQGVTNGRQGFPTEQRQGTEAVKSAAYSRKSKKTLVAEAERAGSGLRTRKLAGSGGRKVTAGGKLGEGGR